MKAQELKFGQVSVWVVPSPSTDRVEGPKGTVKTAAKKAVSFTDVLKGIAKDIGDGMNGLKTTAKALAPNELTVEFQFGFKEGSNLIFANVEGEQAIKVTMVWRDSNASV